MKSDPELADDQLPYRRGQTRVRRWTTVIGLGGLCAIFFAAAAGYYLNGGRDGFPGLLLGTLTLFMLLSLEINSWRVRPLKAPNAAEREWIRRHTDKLQRARSFRFLWSALITLLMAPCIWLVTGQILDRTAGVGDYALMFFWWSLIAFNLASIDGRTPYKVLKPAYEDEFSQALRSRALMLGFHTLSFGVVWAFIMAIDHPAFAVQALPIVLLGADVVATVSFAVMDLRADRGE